jgi:hypothetical protein
MESLEPRLAMATGLSAEPTANAPAAAADEQVVVPLVTAASPLQGSGVAVATAAFKGAAVASSTMPSAAMRRADYRTAYDFTVRYLPRFQTYSVQASAINKGRVNTLIGPENPLTPDYKSVVAINVDTLYTSATVDLTREPQILTIPGYKYSYSIIQVDGSGTVLSTGLKNTPQGGTYALVGPNFRGPLPRNLTGIIRVGVNWSQLAIRTSVATQNGEGGYTDTQVEAEAFRRATRLQSLSAWQASPGSGGATQILPIAGNFSFPMKTFVDASLLGDPRAFLDILQVAMRSPTTSPLSAGDRALIRAFDNRFGAAKQAATQGAFTRLSDISAGARAAHDAIIERWRFNTTGNNWVHFNNLGNWGRNYLDRAAGNLYLQYGNVREAAYYAQAFLDNRSLILNGALGQTYTITFAADQIPQCSRFWSITAYTGDAVELVPNAANKYHVASYTPGLVKNPDGSITITLRTVGAAETFVAPNVLPIPAGMFSVMLRVYGPLKAAKAGTYVPPVVMAVPPAV